MVLVTMKLWLQLKYTIVYQSQRLSPVGDDYGVIITSILVLRLNISLPMHPFFLLSSSTSLLLSLYNCLVISFGIIVWSRWTLCVEILNFMVFYTFTRTIPFGIIVGNEWIVYIEVWRFCRFFTSDILQNGYLERMNLADWGLKIL